MSDGWVISVATTPDRIGGIEAPMRAIAAQGYPVHLWACRKIARSPTVLSQIPSYLLELGVNVHLTEDRGPITKLLPAFEAGYERVVTLDDDMVYGPGYVERLVEWAEKLKECAVGYRGRRLNGPRYRDCISVENVREPSAADILLGVGGVAYRREFFDDGIFREWRACPQNDDLCVTAHLRRRGIRRMVVPREAKYSSVVELQATGLYQQNQRDGGFNDRYLAALGLIKRPKTRPAGEIRLCAVIMTAWKSAKWIEDAIASYLALEPVPGWRFELRIGVDGCEETEARLRELGVPFWLSRRNVGTYVMRNSLIGQARADAYCSFDSDDVFAPAHMAERIPILERNGVVGCTRIEVTEDLRPIESASHTDWPLMFSDEVWQAVGGYRAERACSDGDFAARIRNLGWKMTAPKCPGLMLRRNHDGQMTKSAEFGVGRAARIEIARRHRELREAGSLYVEPVTVGLEKVDGDFSRIAPRAYRVEAPSEEAKPVYSAARFMGETKRRPASTLGGRVDLVYPYRATKSAEMLLASLESVRRHGRNVRHAWVVGDEPPKGAPEWVGWIGTRRREDRYVDAAANIMAAALSEAVTDPFVLMNDDFVLLAEFDATETMARTRGPMSRQTKRAVGKWGRALRNARNLLEAHGFADPISFDGIHEPLTIFGAAYREAMMGLWMSNGHARKPVCIRSVYGNVARKMGLIPRCPPIARDAKGPAPVAGARWWSMTGTEMAKHE